MQRHQGLVDLACRGFVTCQCRSTHFVHELRGNISRDRNITLATHQHQIHRGGIVAGIDINPVATSINHLATARHVTSGVLDANDIGDVGQAIDSIGLHINSGTPGDIVEYLRYRDGIGHRLVVLIQAFLRRLIIIWCHQQAGVDSGLLGAAGQLDRLGGGIGAGTADNRNAAVSVLYHQLQAGAMFVHVEGRRLTGGAHGNNGVGPVFNMKIYQALECRHVDGAIAVHRRDQSNHTSVKHCKKIRTREMKHRMVLGPLTPDKLWPQTASEYHNSDAQGLAPSRNQTAMTEKTQSTREIRINPIVPSESVLVATARGMRPKKAEEPAPRDTRAHVDTCPFCTGNEHMTPPEIAHFPADGDWQVRIVENLYPVLGDDRMDTGFSFGLQQTIDGYGRHEVIIDHSQHGIAFHEMSEAHIAQVFSAYRERMEQLYRSDERLRYVLVFKNFGPAAGASIPHTHSQIIATPVIPENVMTEVLNSHAYYQKHRQCIFCSLIDEALTFEATIYDRTSGEIRRKIGVGQYIIEKSEHFVAIKPFASRYEWEVHILPLQHAADFMRTSEERMADLAHVMRRTMARLEAVLGGAQYNFFLHTVPHDPSSPDYSSSYHWHLEICPRTSIPTGFELGSGLFVNTISPEEAADKLRSIKID